MHEFEKEKMREFILGHKANFVDANDVLVGFDASQSCCESFGWFYSDTVPQRVQDGPAPSDLDAYIFDPEFFHRIDRTQDDSMVVFKLLHGTKVLYLCLHNTNGTYYSHGFHLEVGGKMLRGGSI
jgi:hypothetical protein